MTAPRCLLAVLLALSLLLGSARLVAAQEPATDATPPPAAEAGAPPEPAATPTAPAPSPPSPVDLLGLLRPHVERLVAFIVEHLLVDLLRALDAGLHRVVGALLASSLNAVTQTHPHVSYAHPKVVWLAERMRAVANAALVLVALWGGLNAIAREHLGATYHTALELVPRLAVGALLVNTSGSWTRLLIDLNNALCQAAGGTDLPLWNRVETSSSVMVDLIATFAYLAACLLLVIQALMRLALVDALVVVAPLGLLCWVLPQTQGWARLWSSTFAAAVFTQFLQVVALSLGGSLLAWADPAPLDAAGATPFLGVAALLLALRVPSLVRVQMGHAFAPPRIRLDVPSGGDHAAPAGRQLVLPGFRGHVR